MTFGHARWLDFLSSLMDMELLATHLRVERWTLDESPLARRLFEEVGELLYRENRFMRGVLKVGGRIAAPEQFHNPILTVVESRSSIVPPQSALPFHDAVRSGDKSVFWYDGDIGVSLQHVGPLVGRTAHAQLWPRIIQWTREHWQASQAMAYR
jgi:polyhydroxyalkanoate synthase